MNFHNAIFLFFAGALDAGINAVAGGGSFVAFPALLFTGVPAIRANATNTLALWVGTTASGGAYPQKRNIPGRIMIPLVITSVVGGLASAFLLTAVLGKRVCDVGGHGHDDLLFYPRLPLILLKELPERIDFLFSCQNF